MQNAREATQMAADYLACLGNELAAGSSETLVRYLQAMAKFYRYSFYNCCLIAVQRPNATRVAGYKRWKEMGRHVRAGEKGIMILAPCLRRPTAIDPEGDADSVVTSFTTTYVWDIKQTDGEPLPQFAKVTGDVGDYLARLKSLCNDYGTSVILIHHLRKDASAGPLDRNRTAGSAQIMATCSADWILKQDLTENGRTFKIRITGRLIGQKELVVQSTSMTDYAILREGAQAASTRFDENLARMREIVREGAPKVFVRKELMENHGFREGTVSRCMKKLGNEPGFDWEERKGVWFDGKEGGEYNPFESES